MDTETIEKINLELTDEDTRIEPAQSEMLQCFEVLRQSENTNSTYSTNTSYINTSLGAVAAYGATFNDKSGKTHYITNYYLPKGLDLELLLSMSGEEFWLSPIHLMKLRFIISFIVFTYMNKEVEWFRWVNIHSDFLRKVLTWRFCKQAISLLERLGIIDINPNYSDGGLGYAPHTKSYRLRKQWGKETQTIKCRVESKADIKLAKIALQDNSNIQNEVQEFIFKNLKRLTYDMPAFEAAHGKAALPQETIERLEQAHGYLEAGKIDLRPGRSVKRLTHTVIRMPKGDDAIKARSFLRLDKSDIPLMEIDCKSAQPVMLLSLYENPDCEEAVKYKTALENGIYAEVTDSKITKDAAKKQFGVFISHKYRGNTFGRGFELKFPILNAAVRNFNGSLSAHLQNVEADIIIYTVISTCRVLELFAVSMHDGLIILRESFTLVKNLLQQEFCRRFNFTITVETKWEHPTINKNFIAAENYLPPACVCGSSTLAGSMHQNFSTSDFETMHL